MITEKVVIELLEVKDAPNYKKMPEKFTMIAMKRVIIVKSGMESGKPSVDIQCEDEKGNKFLIFAKGGVVSMVGAIVRSQQQVVESEKARG